jgi:hypothetical protein
MKVLFLILILILIYLFQREFIINNKEKFIPTNILTSYTNLKKNIDIFKIVKKILDINNIKYFINGGVLLGICRNNKIMPWDDDIDICIFEKDEKKLLKLRNEFNKYGLDITTFFAGYKIYLINGDKIKENYKFNYPFIDVFIVIEKNGKYIYKSKKANKFFKENYPINDILPLKEYQFEDMKVLSGNNVEKLCDLNFPNWKNYAIKNYNHITHNNIIKTEFIVDYNKKLFIWNIKTLDKDIKNEKIKKYLNELNLKYNINNLNDKRLIALFLLYQYGGIYIENYKIDSNLLNNYHIVKKDYNYAIRIGNKTLGEFLQEILNNNINRKNIFNKFDDYCKNDTDLIINNYYLIIK